MGELNLRVETAGPDIALFGRDVSGKHLGHHADTATRQSTFFPPCHLFSRSCRLSPRSDVCDFNLTACKCISAASNFNSPFVQTSILLAKNREAKPFFVDICHHSAVRESSTPRSSCSLATVSATCVCLYMIQQTCDSMPSDLPLLVYDTAKVQARRPGFRGEARLEPSTRGKIVPTSNIVLYLTSAVDFLGRR